MGAKILTGLNLRYYVIQKNIVNTCNIIWALQYCKPFLYLKIFHAELIFVCSKAFLCL